MKIKAVVTDMDGTFLDDRGGFDRTRFERVLEQLEKREIPFIVASGNGLERLLDLFVGFEDRIFFLAENGGLFYHKGQTIFRKILDRHLIEELIRHYQPRVADYCLMVSSDTTMYIDEQAPQPFEETDLAITAEQLQAFWDKIVRLPNLLELPADATITHAGFWVPEELVADLVTDCNEVFGEHLLAVTSGYGSVSILPKGVHKAWGLEQILQPLGIDASEVLAFGDSDNDLELLAYAGYSYAMENASERVQTTAKFCAPSHTEQGVLQVIEDLVLGAN
ncbi:Cof-type HAD-IIB family hydrolase [Streptococcus sp. zg-86]|uniref:Cof-type HAD-IIB family hydrolase n=1 Tax=Streptococcus zhangguiae TaxID=2664091 RepID=A0A6I4RDU7_9STRE|nr:MULTISPECIES: Cof-type HAD-IIB family hydrolase [unclassified Streptococcus]MTB63782.1 Cof-type HAD-IIB family hydrolase [Streptococcus sp. zg-86]MTB90092.1 Cof-type HAD-IIB family hydrolase [Streptococcus sp. zg-36]MWV55764.1 Cof-type HAD-IIB family hydrolase [Streptococcus sp. zg-70]QTH47950.1 HAD family hydrolase [Streptococcus sp. zg-86]